MKALHNYCRQVCAKTIELPDDFRYAEAHHTTARRRTQGPDVEDNVLCVCPNHHAELDLGLWHLDSKARHKVPGHTPGSKYIRHHTVVIRKRWQ